MSKKTVRMIIDTLMSAIMMFEMFIQVTGVVAHEIAGLALFVTVAIHLALSASWFRGTAHALENGKLTTRRGSQMLMAALLGIDVFVLGVSSIAISQTLNVTGAFLTIAGYSFWFVLHAFSSRVLCALTVIHLAMHWVYLAVQHKVPFNPERRQAINVGVGALSALGAAYLGLTAVQTAAAAMYVPEAADEPEPEVTGTELPLVEESSTEEPVTEEPAVEEPVAEEPVTEVPTIEEPVSQPDQQASEQAEADEEEEEELVYCPLCHNHCLLAQHRCQRPVMAGLIDA